MSKTKNALCRAKGFKAGAIACGLKKDNKLDLSLIFSDVPAVSCARFTKNRFAAAPVIVCKEHLRGKQSQAIVVNSGNANCYTGEAGLKAAKETARLAARLLGIKDNAVLVSSTGIIGRLLDVSKIARALPFLVKSLNKKNGKKVAYAIMTTDTRPKEDAARVKLGNSSVTIGGIAKGAGMVAPDMATMLCFITTDAAVEYAALKEALGEAVETSFNMITIDGCMSTNDSVIILANGMAKNPVIRLGDANFLKFKIALKEICLNLAKMIVRDAEGASKFITIEVSGAQNNVQAKKAALSIANSNLFKAAVYGQGQNWGRIIAAIGASGVKAKERIKLEYSSFKKKNILVKADLGYGMAKAVVYTSDLTPEYVRINAEYN